MINAVFEPDEIMKLRSENREERDKWLTALTPTERYFHRRSKLLDEKGFQLIEEVLEKESKYKMKNDISWP